MDKEPPPAGTYREALPPPALRRHFGCVWLHRGADRPSTILVVPDGSIDLCLRGGRLVVTGPDRMAVREALPADAVTIGLRFRAGAASSWLGVPATALAGRRIPLEELWGEEARRIAEAASARAEPPCVLSTLETALARRAAESPAPDPAMRRVFALLRRPSSGPPVARLAGLTGTSERTLRRRCHEAFGYGPKPLERILRFQRFLGLARTEALAAAAAGAGYADQAHLSRDVRQLCGLTPAAVIAEIAG